MATVWHYSSCTVLFSKQNTPSRSAAATLPQHGGPDCTHQCPCPRPPSAGQPPERPRGQRKPLPQQVAASLDKSPGAHTSHDSSLFPAQVPKMATQVGWSCYREGLPAWLQPQTGTGTGSRSQGRLWPQSKWLGPSEVSLSSILGRSLVSGHSPGALNEAMAEMITETTAKWLKGATLGTPLWPSQHPLSSKTGQDKDDQGQATKACQYPLVCCDKEPR